MIENYEQYNDKSEQDKESMIAKASENSNQNEVTLIANTDEVESKLTTVISKLDSIISYVDGIEGKLDTIITNTNDVESKIDATKGEITTQGQAIVAALTPEQ